MCCRVTKVCNDLIPLFFIISFFLFPFLTTLTPFFPSHAAKMDNGKRVWAPDIAEGFIIGEVCDFGT